MSKRLPSLSTREFVAALRKAGFVEPAGRGDGSHRLLLGGDPPRTFAVSERKALGRGLLGKLIRQVGPTRDEFLALL